MSSREWLFRIQDILDAINKIEKFIKKMTLRQFKNNDLVRDAVIRNFEVIGEASKSISPSLQRTHSTIPWKKMSNMRNLLIHQYFGVDVKIVWRTAKKSLPGLKKQLERLLKDATSPSVKKESPKN